MKRVNGLVKAGHAAALYTRGELVGFSRGFGRGSGRDDAMGMRFGLCTKAYQQ